MLHKRFGFRRLWFSLVAAVLFAGSVPVGAQSPITVERVSVTNDGAQADGSGPSMSADGRYVGFLSRAPVLGWNPDMGEQPNIRDRQTGTTDTSLWDGLDGSSMVEWRELTLSAAGSHLAGIRGPNSVDHRVTLIDRATKAVLWTSPAAAVGGLGEVSLSADGKYIAFSGHYTGPTVPADTNAFTDVFVHDVTTGVTRLASVAAGPTAADGDSSYGVISGDGRFLAFVSSAPNLTGAADGTAYTLLLDLATGALTRLATAFNSGPLRPAISANGGVVAFATNDGLVPEDTDLASDVYVFAREAGTFHLISDDADITEASAPVISGNGRIVLSSARFASDGGVTPHLLRVDRTTGVTTDIGTDVYLEGLNTLSGDGCQVAFVSERADLVPGDTNGTFDVFVASFGSGCGVELPTVSAAGGAVAESAGSLAITVTLSAASTGPVIVDYATSDGTATAGLDYTATSGTLTFQPGETSKTVDVSIFDDGVEEATKTFTLTLTNPSGAALGTASAIGTILDDDDTTPPVLSLPADFGVDASSPAGELVFFEVTATDNRDPSPAVSCTPPSGSLFPVGATVVQCTATDAAGNVAAGGFTVTVTLPPDETAPLLSLPGNLTVAADSAAGKVVTFAVTATDNRDPSPAVSCTPASGSLFPVGVTTVQCTATDAAGNSATGSFTVTVTPWLGLVPLTIEIVRGGVDPTVRIAVSVQPTSQNRCVDFPCVRYLEPNSLVMLTAHISGNFAFPAHWEGCDMTNGLYCWVIMERARTAVATYSPTRPHGWWAGGGGVKFGPDGWFVGGGVRSTDGGLITASFGFAGRSGRYRCDGVASGSNASQNGGFITFTAGGFAGVSPYTCHVTMGHQPGFPDRLSFQVTAPDGTPVAVGSADADAGARDGDTAWVNTGRF